MNPPRILCVGLTPCVQRTLIFDRLRTGEVNRAIEVRETVGGKAANTAKVIRALGAPVRFIGFAGGATGRQMESRLRGDGVQCACIQTAAPTRYCQTLRDLETGRVTELVEEAILPTPAEWDGLYGLFRTHADEGHLVLAGKPPPGAADDTYARLLKTSPGAAAHTLIDAYGPPLRAVLRQAPFLVKMNREELAATLDIPLPDEASFKRGMEALCALGAGAALVTHGAHGALLCVSGKAWQLTPPSVRAVNPVGSGDAASAGIIFALARGEALLDAVGLGMACGAANALTHSAGEIDPATVDKLRNEVRIRPAG